MGRTKVRGIQIVSDSIDSDIIKNASVSRNDLNVSTVGGAVIAKVIQGSGITITSTGADSGTGDVTINTVNNGTVTSVGLALPAIFTVSNSPVTSSGTLTAVLASQTANTFLAAPNGSAGVPSFRAIVAADIPTLNQTTTGGAGTLVREDNRVISPSELTAGRLRFSFTSWNNDNNTPYADGLHLRSYTDASGGNDNLVMFRKDAIGMRVYQQTWGSATAYATYKDVAFTDSNITGSAATLTTARNINGTAFNGSADITTANWGTARTITIGSTGKSVNGSANVAWTTAEIGAEAQAPDNVPRSNLGNPTVREMALFDAQYDNKTERHPIASVWVETSADNITWTDAAPSDTNKRRLVGGDQSDSGISIPYGTAYFRIRLRAQNYVFLNALYMYWSSQGHSSQVQIFKKHDSGAWTAHTSSATTVSSWPGHLFLPFGSAIPWNPTATLGTHFHEVYVLFIPSWNATYPSNNIALYRMQWWGGYPAGRRNLYTTTEFGAAIFPDTVSATALTSTVATGTAPLTVTSTTRVANLNVATAGTADTWTTARTITIGSTGKSVNGSADVAWSLAEIGAQAAGSYATTSDISITANRLAYGNATGTGITSSAKFVVSGSQLQLLDNGGGQTNLRLGGGTADNNWGGGLEMTSSNGTTVLAKMVASVNGIFFSQNGTDHFAVARSTGNFMIGTTTDSGYKLDVFGTTRLQNLVTISQSSYALDFSNLGVVSWSTGGVKKWSIVGAPAAGSESANSFNIYSNTDGATRLSLTQGGSLLIGTTTDAGYKLDVNGTARISGVLTALEQIVSTKANDTATGGGQLYLNGATGNRIDFNANGAGAPTVTTRSVGTKLVLNPSVSASAVDTAIGFSSDSGVPSLWFSIPSSSTSGAFRWYTGATERIRVDQAGQIRFTAGTVSAPVISAGLSSSDTNTGIYFPAADTIGFVEGGVEAMRIDSNGRINVLAGTAALPAISAGLNSSDTNTGIYFPAADSISIATAGVERMNINSSGVPTFTYADNTFQGVNIRNTSNTSNALNGLTIYDAANSAMGQINYVNAIYANSSLQDTFVINSVGDRKLGFIANSNGSAGGNSDIYFQAGSTTAGRIIYISGIDGVISVGMGASEASNTRMQIRGIGATSSTATLRVENSAGTEALTVMDDGQIRVRAGTVSLPSISAGLNSSDTNTGIYFPATDAIALATNGTRRLRADATGVGIHVDPTEWIHLSSDPASSKYIQIDAAQYNAAPLEYTPSGGLNKIYGSTSDNNALGTPDYWMEIKLDGTIVLIPCYAPYYP